MAESKTQSPEKTYHFGVQLQIPKYPPENERTWSLNIPLEERKKSTKTPFIHESLWVPAVFIVLWVKCFKWMFNTVENETNFQTPPFQF